ncbi:MAG: CPXCG motif-containing cysteine-rich protein [Pirellulales bacterium]|nr:CPXCG motif-containing cysteine-rich protein [Pirellulales bacterium]
MQNEANYLCQNCGELIVVPIDISAGSSQSYSEDCPVCCRTNLIRLEIGSDGQIWMASEIE